MPKSLIKKERRIHLRVSDTLHGKFMTYCRRKGLNITEAITDLMKGAVELMELEDLEVSREEQPHE